MPKVGKKHFSYTKEGKEAAKAYAKKSGKKVSYKTGGKVEMYQDQLRRKYHGK
tara:strand:+ start:3061 stop:3219 length:159 start_codon:yes stop_codon:yes gene_type:complete